MSPSWPEVLVAAAIVVCLLIGIAIALRRQRRVPAALPSTSAPSAADRLRRGLRATRERLAAPLDAALARGKDDGGLAGLEEVLVAADVGVRIAADLVAHVRTRAAPRREGEALHRALRDEVRALLDAAAPPEPSDRPWVVLVTGVNGVGKTTTIGKLAALHRSAGRRVVVVAADTFRAAAIEQLAVWAERAGAELVRQEQGASPAAVVFDGLRAARARDADVVLVDTAGRLHTRTNLMEELKKVHRVVGREMPGAPHEVLLVLDATTGQNAIAQARTFAEAISVTGVVLTKLDGTARGGVAIAVRRELGVPIRYVGVGEEIDDLRPFDADEFVDALLGTTSPIARAHAESA